MAATRAFTPGASDHRLDWGGDVQGPLLLLVGGALILGAVAAFVFTPGAPRWPIGGVLLLVGYPLFRAGWRWPRSYATDQGLLRVRRGSQVLTPWAEVDVIELQANQDPSLAEAVALLKLRLADARVITIRSKPARLHDKAVTVRRQCPQAFVDDRRSGEIHRPTTGAPEDIERREAVVVRRARRGRRGLIVLWSLAAVASLGGAAACAVWASRHGDFHTWSLCGVMLLGVGVSVLSLKRTLR